MAVYLGDREVGVNNTNGTGGSIIVDDELSLVSENPVQNKVITRELEGKQDTLTAGPNINIENGVIEGLPAYKGDWIGTKTYEIGDIVRDVNNRFLMARIQNTNVNPNTGNIIPQWMSLSPDTIWVQYTTGQAEPQDVNNYLFEFMVADTRSQSTQINPYYVKPSVAPKINGWTGHLNIPGGVSTNDIELSDGQGNHAELSYVNGDLFLDGVIHCNTDVNNMTPNEIPNVMGVQHLYTNGVIEAKNGNDTRFWHGTNNEWQQGGEQIIYYAWVLDENIVYTTDSEPTTESIVYSDVEVESSLTISSVGSDSITLSDNNEYSSDSSKNKNKIYTVAESHPNWICFIDGVGVKIGNTLISASAIFDDHPVEGSTNGITSGAVYNALGDIETILHSLNSGSGGSSSEILDATNAINSVVRSTENEEEPTEQQVLEQSISQLEEILGEE